VLLIWKFSDLEKKETLRESNYINILEFLTYMINIIYCSIIRRSNLNRFDNTEMVLFEHKFWLQVLGDHSRMLLNSFSPEETEDIKKARYFINLFDSLLSQARMNLPKEEIYDLNLVAYNAAQEIRGFKLDIIKRQIAGNIKINMVPTFVNHMVNEVEEYLFILCSIIQMGHTEVNPLHHHLLWLLDGAGHAYGISGDLDMVEKAYIEKSRTFAKNFDNLYLKSVELRGYMRTGLPQFPSLDQLTKEAYNSMSNFKDYLKDLFVLVKEKKILGAIMPLVLDHMYREECYYLTKLSMVSQVEKPECDPTKPREE
jgi:hypothetical protein